MSMQRYSHEFQKISGSREMVENEDGEWIPFEDHEAALASERRANSELAMRERMAEAALASKDSDLADANHMLILANNSADAFRRVAEQRQAEIERLRRAVEWCLSNHVGHLYKRQNWNDDSQRYDYAWTIKVGSGNKVPEEFQDLIKLREPTTGASNG